MATKKTTPQETQAEETAPKKKRAPKKTEADDLKKQIETLTAELESVKDTYLRTRAEYDNFRKRTQREKEASYSDAKANTLKMLLPVLDNFDRAADNTTDDLEVYRKGIEMILTQFDEILKTLGVESFGEVGEEFDPNIHSAVMSIENPDLPENSIAMVFEKGYKMGDKILRFATVQVTK